MANFLNGLVTPIRHPPSQQENILYSSNKKINATGVLMIEPGIQRSTSTQKMVNFHNQQTPISARRKLGNVSNTPIGSSGAANNSNNKKIIKKVEDTFVKPSNLPPKKKG